MFDGFPYEFEALYVHVVQDIPRTYGFAPKRWQDKEFRPVFFRTYVDAALHAASQNPPLIRIKGLQRICLDAVNDFCQIKPWPNEALKALRRQELNQDIWLANSFLRWHYEDPVDMIKAKRRFMDNEKVRTKYGIGKVIGFDPVWDLYELELDWRPLDIQLAEHNDEIKKAAIRPKSTVPQQRNPKLLETVVETDEADDEALSLDIEEGFAAQDQGLTTPRLADEPTQEVGQSSAETPVPASWQKMGRPVLEPVIPTSPNQLESPVDLSATRSRGYFRVTARISGCCITSYTPPVLPKFPPKAPPATSEKQKGSIFNFLQTGTETPKQVSFKSGDQVKTPYGLGRVTEHRQQQGMVVVEMAGWHATAYIGEGDVRRAPKSLLGSLMRQLSTGMAEKPLEFPHAEGTVLTTPFGKCKVSRPVPVSRPGGKRAVTARPPTMGLSLESWTLANGSHPLLYCTVETARLWKDRFDEARKDDSGSILTKLVSSSRNLLEPFLSQKQTLKEAPKLHSRYYLDSAAVTSSVGHGVVKRFRPSDGFYEVSLVQWTLADGSHPTAYFRKEDLSHRVAQNCHEGYPVLTSLGLSGTLASVVPTTGVHIVTVPSAGMVCYLQPSDVVRPLKASVGEDVLTAYGEGRVERYNSAQDMYAIALKGWGATLYARGDTFDRVSDGVPDGDGFLGVKWLLSFLFRAEATAQQRSRSNSMVSTHSHSNRSVS